MDSRHYRSSVVRYHYRRTRLMVAGVAIATIALLFAAYFLGRQSAFSESDVNSETVESLWFELNEANAEMEDLSQQLSVEQARHAVDLETMELLRKQMARERELTAELEEGLNL